MNKDSKGLLKYAIPMLIVPLLPTLDFYLCLLSISMWENPFYLILLLTSIILLILLIYFLTPIILTVIAIKKHWSSYLDKFFNNLLLPTFILVTLIWLYPNIMKFEYSDFINHDIWDLIYIIYVSFTPCYFLVYSVIFIHNIIKWIKKFRGKVI